MGRLSPSLLAKRVAGSEGYGTALRVNEMLEFLAERGAEVTPSKAKRSKTDPEDRSWSTTTTCVALAIAWAAIVSGLAANAYHVVEARSQNVPVVGSSHPGGLFSIFLYQSVAELPNAVQVISHAVAEAKSIPCVLVVGEVGVVALWFVLSRLQHRMALEEKRRNRW
jgi:hypothetical protein